MLKIFFDAALVVLGHGTEQNADSAAAVYQHVAELRRRPEVNQILAGVADNYSSGSF